MNIHQIHASRARLKTAPKVLVLIQYNNYPYQLVEVDCVNIDYVRDAIILIDKDKEMTLYAVTEAYVTNSLKELPKHHRHLKTLTFKQLGELYNVNSYSR